MRRIDSPEVPALNNFCRIDPTAPYTSSATKAITDDHTSVKSRPAKQWQHSIRFDHERQALSHFRLNSLRLSEIESTLSHRASQQTPHLVLPCKVCSIQACLIFLIAAILAIVYSQFVDVLQCGG